MAYRVIHARMHAFPTNNWEEILHPRCMLYVPMNEHVEIKISVIVCSMCHCVSLVLACCRRWLVVGGGSRVKKRGEKRWVWL
jgi:hypothetical protein